MSSSTDARRFTGNDRWPPLLLALRRAARPDRARVEAYLGLAQRPGGWAAYAEFLAAHRAWLASLDRTLAEAGVNAPAPLPDAADPGEVGAAAAPFASDGSLAAPRSRAEALGYLYVLEAFRLGCSVLARRIRGRALVGAGGADAGPWSALVTALSIVPAGDHAGALQAAKDAFADWERRLAGPLGSLGLGPLSTDAHAA